MLEHTYATAVPQLSWPTTATPWPDPQLAVLNEPLALELGLDPAWLHSPDGIAFLVGDGVPDTVAQAYAGHQFGHFSGVLGDGRALLLGELVTPAGERRDLHLKGSGRTRFSRGGDGRATLGPMLREYVIAEAMHALGVPSTRSLAVLTTGDVVQRERLLPGAVLCRVASSHLRVGTFQLAAALDDHGHTLHRLADHAIDRHHPAARDADDPYLALLEAVAGAQAELVARWQLLGFVHGVMNTDNTTISGETIDYGPCAFLDAYDPATVFSSIDHHGRYAYDQQPAVIAWNIARFAETLLPLMAGPKDAAVDAATAIVRGMMDTHERVFAAGLAAKLGADAPSPEHREFLERLAADRADFTTSFEPIPGVNPTVIPRNHAVERALEAAIAGDPAPFTALVEAVTHPWNEPEDETLRGPAPVGTGPHVTYCGT